MKLRKFFEEALNAVYMAREVPFAHQLVTWLGEISVIESQRVSTAAIRVGAKGRFIIEISPKFAAEHVRNHQDAFALVAHEILHGLRGHFDQAPLQDPALAQLKNIALDVLVDSEIVRRLFPSVGMISRVNPVDQFPAVFLRPPQDIFALTASGRRFASIELSDWASQGYSAQDAAFRLVTDHFKALGVQQVRLMARLYLDGWFYPQDPTLWWKRFLEAFMEEDPAWRERVQHACVLGEHDGNQRADEMFPSANGGLGGALEESEVRKERSDPYSAFIQAIREWVSPERQRRYTADEPGRSVMVGRGRRDVLALAAGTAPAFWTTPQSDQEGVIHLYVDVSASAEELHPAFLAIVRAVGDDLAAAWAFSTDVFPINPRDLAEGRVRTTGGTDLSPVFAHAKRRSAGKIVILTDGLVGRPSRAEMEGASVMLILPNERSHSYAERRFGRINRHEWADVVLRLPAREGDPTLMPIPF